MNADLSALEIERAKSTGQDWKTCPPSASERKSQVSSVDDALGHACDTTRPTDALHDATHVGRAQVDDMGKTGLRGLCPARLPRFRRTVRPDRQSDRSVFLNRRSGRFPRVPEGNSRSHYMDDGRLSSPGQGRPHSHDCPAG